MPTPHRSASMDALKRAAQAVWPGITIYWIGDLAHQGEVSGHNPDDYTGVRAEMLDADDDPEVRAQDFMIGPVFTVDEGRRFVEALTTGADRDRLYYVIYRSTIHRRATGFKAEPYGGANHNDHVHVSGWARDDANGADWTSVLELGGIVALEPDLNAYVDEYAGGPGQTNETQRRVRADWWLLTTGSVHPRGVAGQVAELESKVDQILTKLDSLAVGTTAHTHTLAAGETGPAQPADP